MVASKSYTVFLHLISLLYAVMFLTNLDCYTSIGIDLSHGNSAETHLRIRWPGNGSFWIGWAIFPTNHTHRYIDLAGAFWQPPQAPPQTAWQMAGFWYINEHPAQNTQRHFVGIPNWLPFVGMLCLIIKYRQQKTLNR